MQVLLHAEQLLHLALEQPAYGDAGPAGDDLGDVFGVDLFLEQHAARLHLGQLLLHLGQFGLLLPQLAILELAGPLPVLHALGLLDLETRAFDLFLELCVALDNLSFSVEAAAKRPLLLAQVGQLALKRLQPFLAGLVLLASSAPRARSRAAWLCA